MYEASGLPASGEIREEGLCLQYVRQRRIRRDLRRPADRRQPYPRQRGGGRVHARLFHGADDVYRRRFRNAQRAGDGRETRVFVRLAARLPHRYDTADVDRDRGLHPAARILRRKGVADRADLPLYVDDRARGRLSGQSAPERLPAHRGALDRQRRHSRGDSVFGNALFHARPRYFRAADDSGRAAVGGFPRYPLQPQLQRAEARLRDKTAEDTVPLRAAAVPFGVPQPVHLQRAEIRHRHAYDRDRPGAVRLPRHAGVRDKPAQHIRVPPAARFTL